MGPFGRPVSIGANGHSVLDWPQSSQTSPMSTPSSTKTPAPKDQTVRATGRRG